MKNLLPLLLVLSSYSHGTTLSDIELKKLWHSPEDSAKNIVNNMSFDEQLGQMFMIDIRSWRENNNADKSPFTVANNSVKKLINEFHLGSVILFRENLINTPQTVELINALQAARSNLPLFISTDQEGGYVTRLQVGTEMPGNMALGATGSQKLAEQSGKIHGYELSSLGFNFNFGPVVDVNNNQNNPVIGVRAYSDDPLLVGNSAKAYIEGIHHYPVLTSLKHFPGHGNVASDTHFALPTVNTDKASWHKTELKPFVDVMPVADAIMTAHVVVPALDNTELTSITGEKIGTPATLSKPILTDILRHQLHFKGLILTDAMDMGAISGNFDRLWSIKQAILAGNDIVLMPLEIKDDASIEQLGAVYASLKEEAQKNPQLRKRIHESAERIVFTKLNKQISAVPHDAEHAEKIVGSEMHKSLENAISAQAITLIVNNQVLPFPLKAENNILVYSDEKSRNQLINKHLAQIGKELHVIMNVSDEVVNLGQDQLTKNEIEKQIAGQQFIILTTYNLKTNPANAQRIIDVAKEHKIPLVVISSRNPYDIAYLTNVDANIAIYGITGFDVTNNIRNSLETNIRSGLRTLFMGPAGKSTVLASPQGKLPVEIKTSDNSRLLYSRGHGLTF